MDGYDYQALAKLVSQEIKGLEEQTEAAARRTVRRVRTQLNNLLEATSKYPCGRMLRRVGLAQNCHTKNDRAIRSSSIIELVEDFQDYIERAQRSKLELEERLMDLKTEHGLLDKSMWEGRRRFQKRMKIRAQLEFLKNSVSMSTAEEELEARECMIPNMSAAWKKSKRSKLHKLRCDARTVLDQRWLEMTRIVDTLGMPQSLKVFDRHRLQHYDAAEFDALPFVKKQSFVYKLCSALDIYGLQTDQYNTLKHDALSYRTNPVFDNMNLGCFEANQGRLEEADCAFKKGIEEAHEKQLPWQEATTWYNYMTHVLEPQGRCAEHMADLGRCISQLPLPADTYSEVMPDVNLEMAVTKHLIKFFIDDILLIARTIVIKTR